MCFYRPGDNAAFFGERCWQLLQLSLVRVNSIDQKEMPANTHTSNVDRTIFLYRNVITTVSCIWKWAQGPRSLTFSSLLGNWEAWSNVHSLQSLHSEVGEFWYRVPDLRIDLSYLSLINKHHAWVRHMAERSPFRPRNSDRILTWPVTMLM